VTVGDWIDPVTAMASSLILAVLVTSKADPR
jgi:hypothetical protein